MDFAPAHRSGQAGISLVELLVVITIIAVVASLALMQRGSANEQFQRQNASRELKTAFERARFDSVKRRADGVGVPLAYVIVQATQFTLVTDVNQDGDLLDANDAVTSPFAPNINLTPRSGLNLPLTVSFNRRGEPDVTDLRMVVCNGTCDFDSDTASNANVLHVTATGTVEMMPGGANVSAFPTPAVTSVPGSTSIRSETYIAVPTPTP